MLMNLTMSGFNKELASDSPAPGGGSVAAFSGAMAAGLIAMVCRLTRGKKGLEDQEALMTRVLEKSERLRSSLEQLVDKDTEAFNQVMAAFKLPKQSDEEKSARTRAIQKAFKLAAETPLNTARCCHDLLGLAADIADTANPNCISDVGVAAQACWAGFNGAAMNVQINLPAIKDAGFVDQIRSGLESLESAADAARHKIDRIVQKKI